MNNRVWVYLSDKAFSTEVESAIKADVGVFLNNWNAHGTSLSSTCELQYKHFIIVKADEEKFSASGCSIDKQVRFIKDTEKKYNLSLLNRLIVAYKSGNEIKVVHSSKIPALISSGEINVNTIVFNVGVGNDTELKNNFEIPLNKSWLAKFITAGV
ncbi:MAG TPA: ABC transporter ATPase [Bacteroidia bacterium]|jgi:hypothetical protein|nr:ABC transporter ATPase [Bacteroidia bacterium]